MEADEIYFTPLNRKLLYNEKLERERERDQKEEKKDNTHCPFLLAFYI